VEEGGAIPGDRGVERGRSKRELFSGVQTDLRPPRRAVPGARRTRRPWQGRVPFQGET